MLGIAIACLAPFGLVVCWRLLPVEIRHQRALLIILAGFAARLLVSSIVREFPFFSYGSGGDANGYEIIGNMIARMWSFSGVHYVSADTFPDLPEASLPFNLFAAIIYLNDGPTHIGCVAVVAAIGCATALNIYSLAHTIGCRPKVAMWTLALVTFLPTFVFYTSDTHKDGLVACFIFGVFGSAIRLARRFSMTQLVLGLASLAALWFTRFYLVFFMWVPLTVGLLGVRAKSLLRIVAVALVVAIGIIVSLAYSSLPSRASASATAAYSQGTDEETVAYNAQTAGSGVLITGSGPSAFAQKLAYSLFAPFPWQSGSIGLQLSKLEMLIWYYFAYRGFLAIRLMLKKRRSDLLLFALFIVPTMAAYTLSFANVGLALRERINIVLAILLLASFSWGLTDDEESQAETADARVPANWGALSPSRDA